MFNEFLTTEGERLLAKSIAGTATITFTKMELGDGDRGTASKNITSLESKRLTLDIYSVQLSGDNHITITSILKSENIETGFYYREKAVYATDGTREILFMYGTAGSLAEWIENSKTSVFERTMRTIIALSDGDNISVTIQGGAYASGEDAKNILTAIENIQLDGDWATQSQAESMLSLLDTFVAAYTTLRAGKLDNLDALVSSRAPANTALSNATWTNDRAALLDRLDTQISSRAQASTALSNTVWTNARAGYLDYLANTTYGLSAIMTKLNSLINNSVGIPGTVKSVQRGMIYNSSTITLEKENLVPYMDITIQAVNFNKAVVIVYSSNRNYNENDRSANAKLISSTILRVYSDYASCDYRNVNWQVIDFY